LKLRPWHRQIAPRRGARRAGRRRSRQKPGDDGDQYAYQTYPHSNLTFV
jgi:hypothetical protein